MNKPPLASPTKLRLLPLEGNYLLVGIISLLLYSVISHFSKTRKLKKVLSVGSDLPLLSLWTTFRYITDAQGVLNAGMKKWPGRIVRVLSPFGWEIVLTEPSVIDELRKAPDSITSALEGVSELLQAKWTMGNVFANPYHIPIIRAQLTRALPRIVPELHEEMVLAFDQHIPATESWSRIKVSDTIPNIIARMSNRAFVGVPLCRDPGWIDTNVKFAKEIVTTSLLLRISPSMLRPWVYTWFSKIPEYRRRASQYLAPLITARQKDPEKPLDLLTWLLDEAKGEEATLPFLAVRLLVVNFGSIHTTSMTFTHALFYLAACPEYVQALREEVEKVTECKGWTKASLDEMYKIDSFIKESQRLNPAAMLLMHRSVLRDYTFSDGTTVPAGSTVVVRVDNAHHNAELYPDPLRFDGFRFTKMREEAISNGSSSKTFDIVSVNANYLPFGYGRHACPGRFFAAYELKQMLAHVVLNYDVKFESEGIRPPNKLLMTISLPNPTAEILFRKRKVK